MKKILPALLLMCLCAMSKAQQIKLTNKEVITIHSQSENTERTIYLQLPKDYGKVKKHYPLLLLFDAQDQTLYNYASSAIDRLTWTNDIPEAIFVGIVQNDRSKELNFEKNETSSAQFLNFVKNDLISFLTKKYSLNGYYTLIGHSLGGQFVTNAMLSYPETFKSAISISAALNYPNKDNEVKSKILTKMTDYIAATPDSSSVHPKYYFSSGDDGFQDGGFKLGALKIDSSLKAQRSNVKGWHFDFLKGFNHMTTPLISIPAGLIFIFDDWHFSDNLAMDVLLHHKKDAVEVLKKKKMKIIKSYGTDIALPYNSFHQFANHCMSQGKLNEAEILIKQLIDLYPQDDEPYSLMAEVAIKKGNIKNAVKYFKKAQSKSAADKYADKISKLQ